MNPIILIVVVPLTAYFLYEMTRQFRKLNKVRRLIDTYEHDVNNPKLIDEMYDYCWQDRKLKAVMEKHQPTKERFNKIYQKLLIWGNFRKINRFVPISSFFAVYTLNYILEHENDDPKSLAQKMFNFFNI